MREKLDTDYFDCPHCGVKNVTYNVLAKFVDEWPFSDDHDTFFRWGVAHLILQCTRKDCQRLTYFQLIVNWNKKDLGYQEVDNLINFQYPGQEPVLPDYIPERIRRYYLEAIRAYNFGLRDSASIMCRKVIYELCDKQKATGRDYKEKISNLGLDKRITDPLLNIKNIGDETVHSTGWDDETIRRAIDALGIIIDMVYVQEQRIKDFSRHYSKAAQGRKQT